MDKDMENALQEKFNAISCIIEKNFQTVKDKWAAFYDIELIFTSVKNDEPITDNEFYELFFSFFDMIIEIIKKFPEFRDEVCDFFTEKANEKSLMYFTEALKEGLISFDELFQ